MTAVGGGDFPTRWSSIFRCRCFPLITQVQRLKHAARHGSAEEIGRQQNPQFSDREGVHAGNTHGDGGIKRPAADAADVKPCVLMEKTFSYPSGHSLRSAVWAAVIAKLVPDQEKALVDRAHQIGDDRVMAGMHFPSDVEAGRTLAAAIVKQMMDDPEFQKELAAAKEECAAHYKTPAAAAVK